MNSKTPIQKKKPFITTLNIICDYTHDQFEALLEVISDGFYATSVSKTENGVKLDLFSMQPVDITEVKGRFILMAEIMEMDACHIDHIECIPAPDKNWLEEVYQAFPPMEIGTFYLYGSHYKDQIEKIPDHLIPLQIDAATAFGSGEHPTTRLCLERLSALKAQGHIFQNILDMGCGSGILAIAAQKLWPDAKIYGVDNDAESVNVSAEHAQTNDVTGIHFECADGYNAEIVQNHHPFDLIIANILTRPLISMAPQCGQVAKLNGHLILSGLLDRQKDEVIKAHEDHGFTFVKNWTHETWSCLMLEKK